MSEVLENYWGGAWHADGGSTVALTDPVLGTELVRVASGNLNLATAYDYARSAGRLALQSLSYEQRARMLADCAATMKKNRERYLKISLENSGTTNPDSSIDVDGALFTLGYFAKLGATLGSLRFLRDGEAAALARDGAFNSQHVLVPNEGVALLINAFNFPAWGLWEKAAPALLSGVPVIVKPATSTWWLTHQMIRDVVEANILPPGALTLICGRSEALQPMDLLAFTGSAVTAASLRRHPAVSDRSVRTNIESDSINSAVLAPSEPKDSASVQLLVREVVREISSKSGQQCTAIRRVFVPESHYDAIVDALRSSLILITVGNPRNAEVRMGSLVSMKQRKDVEARIAALSQHAAVLLDGREAKLVGLPTSDNAVVAPWLFGVREDGTSEVAHTLEVFGPVATVFAYRDFEHAVTMVRRGEGSLVCSVFGEDPEELARIGLRLAPLHGRVHIVSPDVAKVQTGHDNVMPMSLHGGPGRAGGGEELGGLRALNFYHRRSAIQAGARVHEMIARVPIP